MSVYPMKSVKYAIRNVAGEYYQAENSGCGAWGPIASAHLWNSLDRCLACCERGQGEVVVEIGQDGVPTVLIGASLAEELVEAVSEPGGTRAEPVKAQSDQDPASIQVKLIVAKGVPGTLSCFGSYAEVTVGATFRVPLQEAPKVLAAKLASPQEIEILAGDGTWQTRTVRLVPVPTVLVHNRGLVDLVCENDQRVTSLHNKRAIRLRGMERSIYVEEACLRTAARAMADKVEVEIISVDGGPETVRRVS